MSIEKQDLTPFNRAAEACSKHRMVMISNERVLVNPRYDDGTDERHNVKEFLTRFRCMGTCGQELTQSYKPL